MPDGPGDRRPHCPRAIAALAGTLAAAAIAVAGCGGGGGESSTAASTTTSAGARPGTSTQSTTASGSTTNTGGDTGTGQVGQHLTIPQVVEAVLTSSDAAKTCGSQYVTQHYLSVSYGGNQGCVQAQNPKNAADSVRIGLVTQASNEPRMASVKASPQGGLYDGEKLTVSVVNEQGSWKIDALKSNAPVGP